MEFLTDPQVWLAFVTLTVMEIVLGIDNIIFLAILVGRLPKAQQKRARYIGLSLAMGTRILLLLSLTWMMKLTAPLFAILGNEISGRDIVLIVGGLFLLFKSTMEIHTSLEGAEHETKTGGSASFISVVSQIAVIDIIFSLDSVITAVGLAQHVEVMVAAIVIAVIVMMLSAGVISDFIDRHPTIKMLALSFLILIGVALIADGLELHIPKGYIYFAMAFSVMVEMLNLRLRKKREPLQLHKVMSEE
jgi:predicted tellurium resistance membrane protein TerC